MRLRPKEPNGAGNTVSRRSLLAAGAALPMLAMAAPAYAAPRTASGAVAASSVAWVVVPAAGDAAPGRPAGPWTLLGYGPTGAQVGQLASVPGTIRRCGDGTMLYLVWSKRTGANLVTAVDVCSAASGLPVATISGATVDVGDAPIAWAGTRFALTADGGRVAVLHRVHRQWHPPEGKSDGGGRHTCTIALEVLDMRAGRTVDLRELETVADGQRALADSVRISPDGATVHVFSRRAGLPGTRLASVGFDGNRLTGPTVRTTIAPAAVDRPVAIPRHEAGQRFPYQPVRRLAGDGRWCVLGEPTAGTLDVLEMASGRTLAHHTLARPAGGRPLESAIGVGASAVAANGKRAWLVDNQSVPAGLWRFDLPTLDRPRHLLSGHPISEVRVAGDGSAVYALSRQEQTMYVLSPAGTTVAAVPVPGVIHLLPEEEL